MSDSLGDVTTHGGMPPARHGDSLADVLERVLDKGIVVAGDIRVNLLDIELLTIRIRLLISSANKAEELGMAWWRQDPFYSGEVLPEPEGAGDVEELSSTVQRLVEATEGLQRRLVDLERNGRDGLPEASVPRGVDDDGTG